MKVEFEIIEAAVSRSSQSTVRPAPSLRVPVTAGNRSLLRWLRAAESSAWEAGRAWKCSQPPADLPPAQNRQM